MTTSCVQPEASQDVFDIDDGVIDYLTEGNGKPRNHHRVQGRTTPIQNESRGHQRKRNGGKANHGGSPLEEEQNQNYGNQHAAPEQCVLQVTERHFDESGGPEDCRIHLKIREPGPQLLNGGFYFASDVEGVRAKLLLHDQQETGPVIDHRVANRGLMAFDDVGNTFQRDRGTVSKGNGHFLEVFDVSYRGLVGYG